MTPGLSFANLAWLVPIAAVWLAACASSVVAFLRAPTGPRARLGLALRLAGVTLVALALLEPVWARARPRPGANHLALLVDDSRSLQLPDASGRPRGDSLRAALAPEQRWQRTLGETYQLKRYRFDARLERVPDHTGLAFAGAASHLGSALQTLAGRWQGAPLAAVVLFSDGNATDSDELARLGPGLPPVYAVVPGARAGAEIDLAVAEVSASETLFEDAPVNVDARIEALGFAGRPIAVELVDGSDRVVETRTLTPASAASNDSVRFRVKPDASGSGPARYRVRVRATTAAATTEATNANNARDVLVPRPRGVARLLYLGGRPNWEYKFLRRALETERMLELTALIRIAPREPKFAFLSRKGEATNPLYRGFGAADHDAERFDEAVLQRLGTRDADELRSGFPDRPEALFPFQAVIIDDVEAGFFTATQQALVDRFVSERGGGLLVLGGLGSFRQGGWARTPIGDLLPVYLDRRAPAAPNPAQFRLSREGWLEAWMRLRDQEPAERDRLAAMPPFHVASATPGTKPGATVLATLAKGNQEIPALVVQRAGEGRVAALMVGDLWRWGMHRDPAGDDDLAKFWRQTLRALVSDVPPPVAITLAPRPGEAGALVARARVRGRDFRPADDARLEAEAIGPDGRPTKLLLEPASGEPGTFETVLRPHGAGVHRVTVRASSADGQPLGEAEAGRVQDLEADEHRSVRPNLAALEALAQRTGGAVVSLDALDELAARLRAQPAPISDLERRSLWDSWLVWAAALACLGAEWVLRRRRGLA